MRTVFRPESPSDLRAIDELNQRAFGGDEESNLIRALRDAGDLTLSLIAESNGTIAGHIAYSPLILRDESHETRALALAPMAVDPNFQRQGIGSRLVRESLAQLKSGGHRAVIVLGHPEYYPRFGFEHELVKHLDSPFGDSEAFMGLEFVPGASTTARGRVVYAAAFGFAD